MIERSIQQRREDAKAVLRALEDMDASDDDYKGALAAMAEDPTNEALVERAIITSKQLDAEAESLRALANEMYAKGRQKQSRAQEIRAEVSGLMSTLGVDRLPAGSYAAVQRRNSVPSLSIVGDVPDDYTKRVPDEDSIRESLSNGAQLEFATLEYGSHVRFVTA